MTDIVDAGSNQRIELYIKIIIALRRAGASIRAIAKLLGVSKSYMGRCVQALEEVSVAEAINLFEQERRNDVSAEAIADHLHQPVAVVLAALNRMLRANDDEASHLGQSDENYTAVSTAARWPSSQTGQNSE